MRATYPRGTIAREARDGMHETTTPRSDAQENSAPTPTTLQASWDTPDLDKMHDCVALVHRHAAAALRIGRKLSDAEAQSLNKHKRDGSLVDWKDGVATVAEYQNSVFDGVAVDTYFSVNSINPAVTHRATKRDVIRFNGCYVDLDVSGIDEAGELVARAWLEVVRMVVETKEIPEPSVMVESGRGLWCLWLLKEGDENIGIPANAKTARVWVALQEKLHAAFVRHFPALGVVPHLRPDRNVVTDSARVMRPDGSINSKAGRRVAWRVRMEGNAPLAYTQGELAGALGLNVRAAERAVDNERRPHVRSLPNNRAGYWTLGTNNAFQLVCLSHIRGGMPEGMRGRFVALLYANSRAMMGHSLAQRCALAAAARCVPPLTHDETLAAISTGRKMSFGGVSFATIAQWLQITDEEARELADVVGNAKAQPGMNNHTITPLPPASAPRNAPRRPVVHNHVKHARVKEILAEMFGDVENPNKWRGASERMVARAVDAELKRRFRISVSRSVVVSELRAVGGG